MPCRSRPANLLRDADIIIDRWSGQLYTTRNPNSDSHHHHRHHHYARQRIKSRKVKTGACRATCLYSLRLLPVAVPIHAPVYQILIRLQHPSAPDNPLQEWVSDWKSHPAILIKHFRHTLGAAGSGKFWNVGRLSCYIIASGHSQLHLHLRKWYFASVIIESISTDEASNIVEPVRGSYGPALDSGLQNVVTAINQSAPGLYDIAQVTRNIFII